MKAIARAGATLVLVVCADQGAKALVRHGIRPGDRHAVFPGVELVHVHNRGVAFGLFSGGGAAVVILIGVALGALIVYFALNADRPLLWLPTGLLLGGALGNLVDRASGGGVTDFIDLPLWPAFNLADLAITIGVLSLLWVLEGPRHDS